MQQDVKKIIEVDAFAAMVLNKYVDTHSVAPGLSRKRDFVALSGFALRGFLAAILQLSFHQNYSARYLPKKEKQSNFVSLYIFLKINQKTN